VTCTAARWPARWPACRPRSRSSSGHPPTACSKRDNSEARSRE
jgi:hypothetical protein